MPTELQEMFKRNSSSKKKMRVNEDLDPLKGMKRKKKKVNMWMNKKAFHSPHILIYLK